MQKIFSRKPERKIGTFQRLKKKLIRLDESVGI
jgi:hypothetical protein